MDTTVDRIGDAVVEVLRAAGYLESTIGQYEKFIRYLKVFVADHGGGQVYTPALGAAFAADTISPRTGKFSNQRRIDYRRLVTLFDGYLATGTVDLSVRKRGGGGQRPQAPAFIDLDTAWEAEMVVQGLAPATVLAYGRVTREYLVFLESRGVTDLDGADGASVLDFLEMLLERLAKSSLPWVVSSLRPFLKYRQRTDLVDALNLARVRRTTRIVEQLSDQDRARIVQACLTGVVGARDAAITLLALSTGLRACDIVNLRLGDIDWRAGTISIVQAKTGNPLTLPLPEAIRARLGEYILTRRPASEDDHVFLRTKAPHTPLGDHATIYVVTARVFRAAGTGRAAAGTSLLRHCAASRLVNAGVPLPTISAVLGHASPESTNGYISVDHQRLRDCVLPVPAGARP